MSREGTDEGLGRSGRNAGGSNSLRHPREGGASLLLAAADVARRGMGTSRSEPWTPRGFQLICEEETGRLRRWADADDFWVDIDSLGVYRRGRREHDLFRRPDLLGTVFKITRGAGYGLAPSARDVV